MGEMSPLDYFCEYHSEWLRMARAISPNADDILQEAYLKIYSSFSKRPEKLAEMHYNQLSMYMWLTLKSCSIRDAKCESQYSELPENLEQCEEKYIEPRDAVGILKVVQREVTKWDWYEKRLFELHYEQGIPMRKISRETGISLSSIFHTLKNCRNQLKDKINEL